LQIDARIDEKHDVDQIIRYPKPIPASREVKGGAEGSSRDREGVLSRIAYCARAPVLAGI
jgi:hypothetical protein